METTQAQRSSNQGEAERLQQEHSARLRELRQRQQQEMEALTSKHEADMHNMESAYQVELSHKQADFERKLNEMNASQGQRLESLAKQSDVNLKQAQETYRMQAEQARAQGEKRLNRIREQDALAEENMNRRKGERMRKEGIPFDGFGSVLEMLKHADTGFREKILGNVRRRDPQLARRLESALRTAYATQQEDDHRAALERGQRAAYTRNYGQ